MLKYALLAGALVLPGAALAQVAPAPGQTPPTTQAAPAPTVAPATPATQPQPAAPATAAQATPAPATPAASPAPQSAQAPAAPATPAADPTNQVATIVDAEFASYDKDGNGTLSKEEFATWMGKLKAASPTAAPKADATADAKWNDAAFAQADADKSKALSKEELTGFLSQSAKTAA